MLANCAPLSRLTGTFAVALVLASAVLVTSARADMYDSRHELVTRQSALSARNPAPVAPSAALPEDYGAGQAYSAERKLGPQFVPGGGRIASETPMSLDLVGQGGPQDELARQIYHTGADNSYWSP